MLLAVCFSLFVCLFVDLFAQYLYSLWTDFVETFRKMLNIVHGTDNLTLVVNTSDTDNSLDLGISWKISHLEY